MKCLKEINEALAKSNPEAIIAIETLKNKIG